MRACKTTCVACKQTFDRFSGLLLNVSDEFLPQFYNLSSIKSATNAHPTLCADCLVKELGRNLHMSDIKFKGGRWMTSNVAYLLHHKYGDSPKFYELIEMLKSDDSHGVLPFRKNETKQLLQRYSLC